MIKSVVYQKKLLAFSYGEALYKVPHQHTSEWLKKSSHYVGSQGTSLHFYLRYQPHSKAISLPVFSDSRAAVVL
jgi:hypothetical protein